MDSGCAGGIFDRAHLIPPKVPPERCPWGNLRRWLGQGADECPPAPWLSRGCRVSRLRQGFQLVEPAGPNSAMGNHVELKKNFYTVLEIAYNQLINIEKMVEAAGIEPASASPPPSALHACPRL
jgi:hypothetical protein